MRSGPGPSRGPGQIFLIELFKIVSHEHMGLGPEVWSQNRSELIKQLATIFFRSQSQGFPPLKLVK